MNWQIDDKLSRYILSNQTKLCRCEYITFVVKMTYMKIMENLLASLYFSFIVMVNS